MLVIKEKYWIEKNEKNVTSNNYKILNDNNKICELG